ncbi:hypothetical protein Trydic_g6412 [Trypoxylus dichotomus]
MEIIVTVTDMLQILPTQLDIVRLMKGSALSPVLSTTYIMDIPKPKDLQVLYAIYADDTTASRHSKIVATLAQAPLTKIEEFFSSLGLKINLRKTQAPHTSRVAIKDYRHQHG